MDLIEARLPDDSAQARAMLYEGVVFKTPANAASTGLAEAVLALLREELGGDDVRDIAAQLPADELFRRIGRVRRILYTEERWHDAVRRVLAASGFAPQDHAFDPLRLRTVLHQGHTNPAAAAVYIGHRDTWYAHPQCALTWWIPLDDLAAHETFVFYPDRLRRPVGNNSEIFDYDAWVRDGWDLKIGWQNPAAAKHAVYPATTESLAGLAEVGFSCRKAENLIFAGAHLHRTLPQATGRTRFSLDFRVVHLADAERGLGAPNVDNRSRGSVLRDYTNGPKF